MTEVTVCSFPVWEIGKLFQFAPTAPEEWVSMLSVEVALRFSYLLPNFLLKLQKKKICFYDFFQLGKKICFSN